MRHVLTGSRLCVPKPPALGAPHFFPRVTTVAEFAAVPLALSEAAAAGTTIVGAEVSQKAPGFREVWSSYSLRKRRFEAVIARESLPRIPKFVRNLVSPVHIGSFDLHMRPPAHPISRSSEGKSTTAAQLMSWVFRTTVSRHSTHVHMYILRELLEVRYKPKGLAPEWISLVTLRSILRAPLFARVRKKGLPHNITAPTDPQCDPVLRPSHLRRKAPPPRYPQQP